MEQQEQTPSTLWVHYNLNITALRGGSGRGSGCRPEWILSAMKLGLHSLGGNCLPIIDDRGTGQYHLGRSLVVGLSVQRLLGPQESSGLGDPSVTPCIKLPRPAPPLLQPWSAMARLSLALLIASFQLPWRAPSLSTPLPHTTLVSRVSRAALHQQSILV